MDIGVGFGKYGVLAREYLELWDGRYEYGKAAWQRKIDGIEAFANYETPLYEYIYDHVYIGDAKSIVPELETKYDLTLMIDVLEHLEKEDGIALMNALTQISKAVFVSVPKRFTPQSDAFGNPYEKHRAHWTSKDFRRFGQVVFFSKHDKTLCLLGNQALQSWKLYKRTKRKRQIARAFPWLRTIYRKLVGSAKRKQVRALHTHKSDINIYHFGWPP